MRRNARRMLAADYRALAEHSPDVIDVFDRDLRHLYINPAGLRLLGLSASQVIGKTIRETGLPEPYRSRWEDRVRQVCATGQPLDLTDAFPGPTGLRHFESRCIPQPDASGRTRSVLVISRDVTARLEVETELARTCAQLQTLLKEAPIGFAFLDRDLRYHLINERLAEINGLPVAAHIGRSIDEIVPALLPMARDVAGRILTTGQPVRDHEFSGETAAQPGVRRLWNESWYPVHGDTGTVIGFGVVVEDITERRRTQDALRKSHDRLERRVRERTARLRSLAAELVHAEHRERRRIAEVLHEDLQQHLVAMQCRVSVLRDRETSAAAVAHDAEWLLDELARTIEISRSLATRLRPPVLYEFGLRAALDWLASDLKTRLGLVVRISGKAPACPLSDEMRAFAFGAVNELLMNVVKHAGVNAARVHLRSRGQSRIVLEVTDTGRGFDPGATNQQTRFGLFSIRERAEALGGRLDVSTRRGKGTCARLTLPAAGAARQPRRARGVSRGPRAAAER